MEGNDERVSESAQQNFKAQYFHCIVDFKEQFLMKTFEQITSYDAMFGFFYSIIKLKPIEQSK